MPEAQGGRRGVPTAVATTLAMLAFAANSLLCRLALQRRHIDPASFAAVRLLSGAIMLAVIVRLRPRPSSAHAADWLAAGMLFIYMLCFALAYVSLPVGTGALLLFGAVQLTMLGAGLRAGESFGVLAWLGLAVAIAGLVCLVSPGIAAPPFFGTVLMAIAGMAWGVYSLRGRGLPDPLAATAGNFTRAALLAAVLGVLLMLDHRAYANTRGIALAVASGAITSGLGYVLWYAALGKLSAMRAATVQLSVPLIAALGGVVFLAEAITPRLIAASIAILGGIAMVLGHRSRPPAGRPRA